VDRRLRRRARYRTYAEPQPILDNHCHLPPADVPSIAGSPTSSRSGPRTITTNRGACARTASRNATGQAMPRPTTSFSPGPLLGQQLA